jgi:Mg-chelatase subunit ChlD
VSFPSGEGGEPRKLVQVRATKTANLIILHAFGLDDVTVDSGGRGEQASIDVMLVVDRSGSMCRDSQGLKVDCYMEPPYPPGQWQPMLNLKEAANVFVDTFDPVYDQLGLVSYASDGTLDQGLTQDFGDVQTKIDAMQPSGYTNIYKGTIKGVEELVNFPPDGNARDDAVGVIVLLTDGEANRPEKSGCSDTDCPYARLKARLAAQEACYRHIVIYTILMGEEALENEENVELMQDIADMTDEGQDCTYATESSYPPDGEWGDGVTDNYFEAPTVDDLDGVFEDIAQRIFTRLSR